MTGLPWHVVADDRHLPGPQQQYCNAVSCWPTSVVLVPYGAAQPPLSAAHRRKSLLTSNTTALGSSSYRCSTADTSSGVAAAVAAAPRRPRVMLPAVAIDLQEMAEWLATRPAAAGQRGARLAAAPSVRPIHRFSTTLQSLWERCADHQALPGRREPWRCCVLGAICICLVEGRQSSRLCHHG